MIIVDTTVWIDYLRGAKNSETLWLEREVDLRRMGLTDLILCEVLQGMRGNAFMEVRDALLKFHIFESAGTVLAIAAAENYQTLREAGYTVRKTIHCLIATFCIEAEHTLLHRDRDFDVFEKMLGLQVVHP